MCPRQFSTLRLQTPGRLIILFYREKVRSCAKHADVLPVSADEISLTGFAKGVEVLTTVAPANLDNKSIKPMQPISLSDKKSEGVRSDHLVEIHGMLSALPRLNIFTG